MATRQEQSGTESSGKKQGRGAEKRGNKEEARFESLVKDYKSRFAGQDLTASLKEWM